MKTMSQTGTFTKCTLLGLLAFAAIATGAIAVPTARAGADGKDVDRYTVLMNQLRADLAARIPDPNDEQRVQAFLASDAFDTKLMAHAVLVYGTPEGLARFARQSRENEQLILQLIGNPALMRQMLIADGARNNRDGYEHFGPAMTIYSDILKACRHASGEGVLQRLAVATALVFANHGFNHDPVQRYLHFKEAYLNRELDPGFETLDTWNLRFVVNGQETDEELAWGRAMLRNYRPDHILTGKHGARYSGVVGSNVHYGSTRQVFDRPDLTNFQNILMNGGICGRRAFFGQFICRAFGVPSIKRPSRAHGALARWTPGGWVVNLGPGWGSGHTNTIYSRDRAFLLNSQARMRGDEAFLQVKRAQWAAAVAGEGQWQMARPGTWTLVSHDARDRIIREGNIVTLATVGEQFSEADDNTIAQEVSHSEITQADRTISHAPDGTIVIPAAAFITEDGEPGASTPRRGGRRGGGSSVAVMRSFEGGLQVYLKAFNRKGVNVLRGGSQTSGPENCSSYRRIRAARMGRYENWGFRAAVSPPPNHEATPELTLALGHGVTMEFVYIHPGTFIMGGYRENTCTFDCSEVPRREVEITRGYYIGKTPVTVAQHRILGRSNPERVLAMRDANHPVGSVSIEDIEWFLQHASQKTGFQVRLPTEAEWEFAARAGTDTDWFFGNDPAMLGEYAWFGANSGRRLQPVAEKKPNPWGLYDVYGNVWERVADIYDPTYFANAPRQDPMGPAGKEPQARHSYRVNVPRAGKYVLTARVVTMNEDQVLKVAVNDQTDDDAITMMMPFTLGNWVDSTPTVIELKQGENILKFSRTDAPQFGIAVKTYTLTPVTRGGQS